MRLSIVKSKNHEFLYIIKDVYANKSRTSKIVKKLGTTEILCAEKKMSRDQLIAWARDYAKQLTLEEKNEHKDTLIPFSPDKIIQPHIIRKKNCGYLFLQSIYYQLNIHHISRNINNKYHFDYDLDAILSDLIFTRILFPSSKLASFEAAHSLLEPPKYQAHDIYRALSVLSKENDYIQSELYKNSHFLKQRNTNTLYYDCTNYYFEIEEDDDFRKYGKGKEHRPNPIVGMGLFMDGDGIPLAFDTYEGNKNEQVTLKPLEEKIIKDFGVSQFIYCSDAGLASKTNKNFNTLQNRAYIITQSLKKLKKDDREVALKHTGFMEIGHSKRINLDEVDFNDVGYLNKLYYKELPIESPVKERLIVTYSPKYANYQAHIRAKQVERAQKMMNSEGKLKKNRKNPNDPARFIHKITADEKEEDVTAAYSLDIDKIHEEAKYDGFYAVSTNLEDDDIQGILNVTERRWQIEECFRIMKTNFKARPVYLQRKDRIQAHFLICFIALIIYRLLEDKLEKKYSVHQIIETLRDMEMVDTQYNGYIPAYTRTEITDELHKVFGFRTDYEIIGKKKMRTIIKNTKNKVK